jgi:predicted nucleic acid-binding protein
MAKKIVVSNSTPLINFAAIDRLDILQSLFKQIIIPPAVWQELTGKGSLYISAENIKKAKWISVMPIEGDNLLKMLKLKIDDGEAEAITLAIGTKASLILLDEIEARDIARSMNLNFMGSIGCLLTAKKAGIIPNIKTFLNKIINDARFWVSKELYDKIIADERNTKI